MFTADFKKCMFANMSNVQRFNEPEETECSGPYPYNSKGNHLLQFVPKVHHHRDLFSIGMILLELLVGSDFFKFKTHTNWTKRLFNAVKPYLDAPFQSLLDYLCFQTAPANINCFLISVLEQ
jgi:hypothetical protein